MKSRIGIKTRTFISFYLFWLCSALVIYLSIDFVQERILEKLVATAQSDSMREAVKRVEARLLAHPNADWEKEVDSMGDYFIYPMAIKKIDVVSAHMDAEQYQSLKDGVIILTSDGFVLKKIRSTNDVLKIGPITPESPSVVSELSTMQLIIYVWGLTALMIALFSYLWLRPVWKDMMNVRKTALLLSSGDFSARTEWASSDIFIPIATAMNSMADRIQRLVTFRKEMTQAMAHELRTPVARIRFLLFDYFEQKKEESETSPINRIYPEIDEIESLITMGLNYARIDSDTIELVPSKQYVLTWIEAQVSAASLGASHLKFESHYGEDLGWFEIDTKMMPYVFRNLLGNAKKHAKSMIKISAERKGNHLVFAVEDDGRGIHPDEYSNIFQPFHRGAEDEEKGISGFGLGLAIAEKVIALHKGTISVSASSLGGACFTVEIPCKYPS